MEVKMPNLLVRMSSKYYLKARRILFRYKNRLTGKTRPGSYPYVSGDSFRAIADHIHDETGTFDPSIVKAGDVVFVNNPLTINFLKEIHPRIQHPYILISHNGDNDIDKTAVDLLDEKIIRFYAQDAVYEREKVIPIPIGIENYHLYMNGVPSTFNRLCKKIAKKPPFKKDKILFRFSVQTNPTERKPALEYFSKHPLMETFQVMLPPLLHVKKLLTYKFVASPPGNSIESSRTWEALLLKTVPIVKDFFAYRYFVSTGLPMWIVRDWHELEGLTEKDLAEKYEVFMKNARWEALHMDFWINKIRADQETVKKIK